MMKHGIDQDALITRFAEATAQQGEALRKAVQQATLKGLQARELTLSHIKQVLNTVATTAASAMADSPLAQTDVEALLGKAFAGMDAALEQAVQAHRKVLRQMVEQGASLGETQLKKALADIEKMEDSLFDAIRKAAAGAGTSLEGPWAGVLKSVQGKTTQTGAEASATLQQLLDDTQKGLRESRALGMKASQAMLDGYATLASGVLIGMSEALQGGEPPGASATRRARKS